MNEYIEVVRLLTAVAGEGRHLDDAVGDETTPLVQQICYGALRRWFYYRAVLTELLDKPLPARHLDIEVLLIAGLYSSDALKRPAHASVNHAVEATRLLGKKWASGLVNAVLRRYGRERDGVGERAMLSSDEAALDHPQWLIDMIRSDWPDHRSIFEAANSQAPLSLRVNLAKTTRQAYLERLAAEDIAATPGELTETAVILGQALPVSRLPGFAEGLVSVQDEAPQLVPRFLHLAPGQQVLDACAAPGGKTCHLLEAGQDIRLTAVDRDRKRIGLINDNLARLGLKAEAVIASSLQDYVAPQRFDRILLDVPCSATGIIRRHPDIKLLRRKKDVDKLFNTQRQLISRAFELLNTGGELLYATCSILRKENDQVVAGFLDSEPAAEALPLDCPVSSQFIRQGSPGLQLLPTRESHDGFYYASLRKVSR